MTEYHTPPFPRYVGTVAPSIAREHDALIVDPRAQDWQDVDALETRWERDGFVIAGAGGLRYELRPPDVGRNVRCVVTGVNVLGHGSESVATNSHYVAALGDNE